MTLIACFTDSYIDILAACLRLKPEKLILVGVAPDMRLAVERYREILQQRGQHTQIYARDMRGMDLADICAVVNGLVQQEANCVIDLTGGDASVVMAVGAVLAGLDQEQRRQVRVEKYDYATDAVVDCIHDNQVLAYPPVELTVEEIIYLHGGMLLPNAYQPPVDSTAQDIAGLWRIVTEDPKAWNRAITYLNELERGTDAQTHIIRPLKDLRVNGQFAEKEAAARALLNKLHRSGIIRDRSSDDTLDYTYRSGLLRYCTRKAGNVLEVKTLLEGRGMEEKGTRFFHDCRMSVNIDWDGKIEPAAKQLPETRNEIDVMLVHGLTPLFISCKNGNVGDEELYKLNTVAQRFGGPHARKMLIATDLDRKSIQANRAFIQRAWDMDILLETDAGLLNREDWPKLFARAM